MAMVSLDSTWKLTAFRMVNFPSGLATCLPRLATRSRGLVESVMRHLILLGLLFLAAPAWAGSPPGEAPEHDGVILVVGDSLSAGYGLRPGEGWVNLLEQRLGTQGYTYNVVNASVSGETTRGGLARLPRALKVHAPDIVVIELGANDGLRGFPLTVMHDNLRQMIELARSADARVLLLGMHLPANYGAEYTQQFHQVFVDLAADSQVPLVPFFLDGVALQPGMMLDDGIHPSAAAQEKMLANVWPALERLLEDNDAD